MAGWPGEVTRRSGGDGKKGVLYGTGFSTRTYFCISLILTSHLWPRMHIQSLSLLLICYFVCLVSVRPEDLRDSRLTVKSPSAAVSTRPVSCA